MTRDLRSLLEDAVGDLRESSFDSDRIWRSGRRRRLAVRIVSGTSLLVSGILVALASQAILGSTNGPERERPPVAVSPSPACPQKTLPNGTPQFAPLTYLDGDKRVMDLAFLDGSTAGMVYPPDLALEDEVIQSEGHVRIVRGSGEVVSAQTVVAFVGGSPSTTPLDRRPDGEGDTLTIWGADPVVDTASQVSLQFGCWIVHLRELQATERDRRTFIENLIGVENASGFLMLDPQPPLVVPDAGYRGPGGPGMHIGDEITLIPGCGDLRGSSQYEENGLTIHVYDGGDRYWCDATKTMSVYVRDVQLAARLINEVSFREAKLVESSR